MESSTYSQPNQPYSPINPTNLDMNFEEFIFSQDNYYNQDYSMGHSSGHGSTHGSAHDLVPVHDIEDDSLVEEKNRVRPRIGAFCAIINNVEANHESSTNDLDVYHKACAEYKMMYKQDFTLKHCYNILKDHQGWKDVEMRAFYNTHGRKKSKTFETTSGSASDGLNLSEEADEAVKETQEFRPMGRDRAKAKKKAAGSSREGSSSLIDLVADKFFNIKQKKKERMMSNNSPI
uniref:No apical meristem-associated C-terminal domain-containing protein n=1 Tax=Tanacetum cinerariifolium TaxID=118510 RepID=A0A699ILG4_TANCI|nr:hypothetical protein [Tanacetum cinerariifolium]